MKLEARYKDKPAYAPVNIEGLGEMQTRGLQKLFEDDGYTVTVTDEPRDVAEREAARAARATKREIPSAS